MRNKSWKKLTSMAMVSALIFIIGCQALSGLDLNKALVDSMLAQSQMSKQTIALNIKLDESKTDSTEEEMSIIKLLSHIKLNLDQVKQESLEKVSIHGSFEMAKRTIPFDAYLTSTLLVLKLEGAKKPLVLDLAGKAVSSDSLLSLGIEKDIIEQFTSKLTKDINLHKAVLGYLIKGMPNPEGISINQVTEVVYGESMSLNHVQAQVDGSQIIPLVRKFVLNLLQDDQGLRELVTQFYDIVQPILISLFDQMNKAAEEAAAVAPPTDESNYEEAIDAPLEDADLEDLSSYEYAEEPLAGSYEDTTGMSATMDMFGGNTFISGLLKGLESVLRDRAMGIEFFHTEVKQLLVIVMVALQSVDEAKEPMIDELLSNKSKAKADLYFDNSGKLRKTKAELVIAPPSDLNEGIEEIKLTLEGEHWNINEPVIADSMDTTDSYMMDSITKPSEMLAILDKDSALYLLLKDDLKITKKSIVLNMYDAEYMPYSTLPYIDRGVTMVPVRFISEQLDADVTFDEKKQEVSVNDLSNVSEIILTLQSKQAVWNGKTYPLDEAVRNRDGTTYVPLKFIANALGAKLVWDEETKTITITRD